MGVRVKPEHDGVGKCVVPWLRHPPTTRRTDPRLSPAGTSAIPGGATAGSPRVNKEESLALYAEGRDAWNEWAEAMLAERQALE